MNDDLTKMIGSFSTSKLEHLIIENENELTKLQDRLFPIMVQIDSIKSLLNTLYHEITLRDEEDENINVFVDQEENTKESFNPFVEKEEKSITDESMNLLLQFSNLKNELEKILKKGAI